MTSREMQYNAELKLNEVHKINKTFKSVDWNIFLNKAQDMLVDEIYSAMDGNPEMHFESDEKTRAYLGYLVSSYSQLNSQFTSGLSSLHDNGVYVALPDSLLYVVSERCNISYTDCNGETQTKEVRVKPIRHDQYIVDKNNPFKKPYDDMVWRMDTAYIDTGIKRHELITDGNITINEYKLRYVRRPDRIDVLSQGGDCELNVMLHEKVVDRAVRIAISTIPKPAEVQPKS